MKLTLGQIADWIHAEGDFADTAEAAGYSIDTRTVGAGELFFAVKGERFDGHDFVDAALANGAVAAVVSMRWLAPDEMDQTKLLRVPDHDGCGVLDSLQRRTGDRRDGLGRQDDDQGGGGAGAGCALPCAEVGGQPEQRVRGAAAVAAAGDGTRGCGDRDGDEPCGGDRRAGCDCGAELGRGVECGAGASGVLSGIVGIARAKYELVQALPEDGIAILNADDAWVSQFGDGRFGRDLGERAMYYGTAETAQVRATEIEEAGLDGVRFTVTAPGEQAVVRLQLMGRHNVLNALAAIAAGLAAGMPLGECAAAIEGLRAGDKRGEVIEWRGARVINDSYNSNPRALDAMVAALAATPVDAGARRIVIAGEMLELGPEGAVLHRACGAAMAAAGIDQVIGVRGLAASLVEGAGSGALFVETPKEAGAWMRANLRAGDVVLLKASRGVRLEQALGELADDAG